MGEQTDIMGRLSTDIEQIRRRLLGIAGEVHDDVAVLAGMWAVLGCVGDSEFPSVAAVCVRKVAGLGALADRLEAAITHPGV
jgi:hypothetical protein